MDKECAIEIANASKINFTLQSLDLGCNLMGKECVGEIVNILKENYSLTEIKINNKTDEITNVACLFL